MKGQRMAIMLVGMLLLTGCTSNMVWVKDGATQQQFSADQFDCKQKAYTMVGGYNSNNLGALVVDSPRFFNECMQAKGYQLTTLQQVSEQSAVSANTRIKENLSHGSKVWIKANMSFIDAETDYRICEGSQGTHRARTCMEALGYRLIYPSSVDSVQMTKDGGVTDEEGWADKVACDAPTLDQVKACMRGKGYVPIGMAHGTRGQYAER